MALNFLKNTSIKTPKFKGPKSFDIAKFSKTVKLPKSPKVKILKIAIKKFKK